MKTVQTDAQGNVVVTETLPDNPDGSQAARSWQVAAGQVDKHQATFAPGLSKGDKSMLADIAADQAKIQARNA